MADLARHLPDHTELPESDGTFVKNFDEHPQSILLTTSILPVLERLHPDGRYAIGQDSGIYWREADPPERGAEAPDWCYVPGVLPRPGGRLRRSYVLWDEKVTPLIALEFASGSGAEERDRTPLRRTASGASNIPGKFWVYEQKIRIPYYGIFEVVTGKLEFHRLDGKRYRRVRPNARGHYPIPPMQVELGVWQGAYLNEGFGEETDWLRWWDLRGELLPLPEERAEQEMRRAEQQSQRAEQAEQHAEQERQRADQAEGEATRAKQEKREMVPQLLAAGLGAEQIATMLRLPVAEIRRLARQ